MSFDTIPEDKIESNQCPSCKEGNVTETDDGVFECDSCGWQHIVSNSNNNQAGYIY